MSIAEVVFDDEKELDNWVAKNIGRFLQVTIYLPGRHITTVSGKGGVPDGFAFDLHENAWYVIEAELLKHGVWPHIAEQIVRFVVATQNPQTRRAIRDHLFEYILSNGLVSQACEALNTTSERLHQQIELFIEGIDPQILIFIDDTNQDLQDMAQALSAQVKIFRVKKFMVNGVPEYHSPDSHSPVIVTEPTLTSGAEITDYDVVEILGGGETDMSISRFKCYRMADGTVIYIKRSKYHARQDYYWYGLSHVATEYADQCGVTHIVFVMGEEGFVRVPVEVVKEFLKRTRTTLHEDGSIRHYHCLISPGPEPKLFYSQEVPSFELSDFYQTL